MHLHAIRNTSKRRWGLAFGKNEKKWKMDDHGSGYHITTPLVYGRLVLRREKRLSLNCELPVCRLEKARKQA